MSAAEQAVIAAARAETECERRLADLFGLPDTDTWPVEVVLADRRQRRRDAVAALDASAPDEVNEDQG